MRRPETPFDVFLRENNVTAPSCGACVPPGWEPLVRALVTDMIALGWDRNLQQIKEKFGGLRFYTGTISAECHERIQKAEDESLHTCQRCGAEGKLSSTPRGWLQTVCANPECINPSSTNQSG